MSIVRSFNREILHKRHGMSHQQIDDYLGERDRVNTDEKMWLLSQVGQFIWVTDKLKEEKITFITTKGPLLSYRIYNDATIRRYGDFDLLVDFDLLEKTIEVLKNNGFEAGIYEWPENKKEREFKRKLRSQYHLYHKKRNINIDLHWEIFEYPPVKPGTVQGVIKSNLEEIDLLNRKFSVLNLEMELLFLVIHGGMHNWRRLKWLVDIHMMVKENTYDREKFVQLVNSFKAKRLIDLCNGMLKEFYPEDRALPGLSSPSKFAIKLSIRKVMSDSEREYESLLDLLKYSWFILTAFPGLKYKHRVIRTWFLSSQDGGAKRISFWKSVGSLINPAGFLKKRYRVE